MIVLLDAGPLGLVTNPRGNLESHECKQWMVDILTHGVRVLVPEFPIMRSGVNWFALVGHAG